MDIQVFGISAVGAIMAIIAMLNQLGVPKKFSPVVSVVLGALTGVLLIYPNDWKHGLAVGVALGLSAVGLHSGVKNVNEYVRGGQQ